MERQPVTVGGRGDTAELRQALLRRLGLRPDASDQEIEQAHNELATFLDLAPQELQSWATARSTDVDEAFALLSGPEDLLSDQEQNLTSPVAHTVATPQDGPDESPRTPAYTPVAPVAPAGPAGFTVRKPRRNQVIWALVPLFVIAVVVGVYYMGKGSEVPGISGTPTGQSSAAPAAGAPTPVAVDPAKLAALTKKVTANPKDVASLQGIADLYFTSANYKTAVVWEQKVLNVDPKNQVALLAIGAAQFNAGNPAEAKKHWLVAAKLYPKNAEVHYDLGFLYLSQTPPDMAKMTAEWKQVVAIDPNSAIAKTVATHLKGAKPTPAASATPGAK